MFLAWLYIQDEETPYAFFVEDKEISDDLNTIIKDHKISTEGALKIIYQPQALFKVSTKSLCD